MKTLTSGTSSRGLLIGLMVAHVLGTLFAYTVYIKFSTLGDGYQVEHFAAVKDLYGDGLSSTMLVYSIYFVLGAVLPGFLAPMFLGLVLDVVTWHKFRDAQNVTNNWHITLKGLKCKYYSS